MWDLRPNQSRHALSLIGSFHIRSANKYASSIFFYYCAFVIYYLYHKILFWQKNNICLDICICFGIDSGIFSYCFPGIDPGRIFIVVNAHPVKILPSDPRGAPLLLDT